MQPRLKGKKGRAPKLRRAGGTLRQSLKSQNALPLTRDYIYEAIHDAERELRHRDGRHAPGQEAAHRELAALLVGESTLSPLSTDLMTIRDSRLE